MNSKQTYEYIKDLIKSLKDNLTVKEAFICCVTGENTNFYRFNSSKIRQATYLVQTDISFWLQREKKEVQFSWSLKGNKIQDLELFLYYLNKSRQAFDYLDENPEVTAVNGANERIQSNLNPLLEVEKVFDWLHQSKQDFVGLLSSGDLWRGSFNSEGLSLWYESTSHLFDYSIYIKNKLDEPKAIKNQFYSNFWNHEAFVKQMESDILKLGPLSEKSLEIPKGCYRVYLSPSALSEILTMVSRRGFSFDNYKKGFSPLQKWINKERAFSPLLTLEEDYSLNMSPFFNEWGDLSQSLTIINKGECQDLLINKKSAEKYQIPFNGANLHEFPTSLHLQSGTIEQSEILDALGMGIYVGHLHYCNWSDPDEARITGMTRFDCFFVKNGKIQYPIKDFRFDVSLYDIWGPHGLEGITKNSELIGNPSTYFFRSVGGQKLPGMIVKEFACVL